jgi:REP element-mobilizing transposase RayT
MELPQRKANRLSYFSYSTQGAYFITICVKDKKNILGGIVGGGAFDAPQLCPSEAGVVAERHILSGNRIPGIRVDKYVVMPNHIHIILIVSSDGASRTSPPTRQHSSVSQFISTFKRFCNKEYGQNIWQRNFHDHIIRNQKDYDEIAQYIHENPRRWLYDELYS